MATLESKIIVIPEKSEITVHPILREIPLKISRIKNINISTENGNVTIKSSADVEMHFASGTQSEYKTITIPDFTETIRGTLIVDEDTSVIELRDIPIDEARALILDYITEHHGAKTSDIIFDLALNVDLVLEILKELNVNEEIMPVETQ